MWKSRWVSNGSLILITLTWGFTFTLTKNALQSVPVYPFLIIRFFIATIFLFVILGFTKHFSDLFERKIWVYGTCMGLFLFGGYAFQTMGLLDTSPATSAFLTGLSVVLVPILSIPLFGQKQRKQTWIAAFLAVIGLGMLTGTDLFHFHIGDIYGIFCAVFIALQILMIEKYGHQFDSLSLATVEICIVTVCSFFGGLFHFSQSDWNLQLWTRPEVIQAILINGILGTSLAYWGQNYFQKFTTAAQIAVIFSMEPVFAALIAWIILGESLTLTATLGGILIFASMLIADENTRLFRE